MSTSQKYQQSKKESSHKCHVNIGDDIQGTNSLSNDNLGTGEVSQLQEYFANWCSKAAAHRNVHGIIMAPALTMEHL